MQLALPTQPLSLIMGKPFAVANIAAALVRWLYPRLKKCGSD